MSQGSFGSKSQGLYVLGRPIRTLADLIMSGFFQGGTLDIFLKGRQHLRRRNVHLKVKDGKITADPAYNAPPLMKFRDGIWKRTPNQAANFHTYEYAAPIGFHDDKGKLMFVSFAHRRTRKLPAIQLVYYRNGRAPTPEDLLVIAWVDGVNPMVGGKNARLSRDKVRRH